MNNREFGSKGEDIACDYLIKNGYEVIERNKYFSKLCEIDIIAKYKNTLVFVEVKTRRTNSFGSPLEAVNKQKYNNIKTGVLSYIKDSNIRDYRIDVIGITLLPKTEIVHIKNV